MIVIRVEAKDVLRYRELRLENLPQQGLIAISGPNESGKSSIGEVICFALFGRTFSLPPDRMRQLVRWGQGDCSVTLDFRTTDGEYRVIRELDRDGHQSAKLVSLADDTVLARGQDAVTGKVIETIGFDYDEFIESFYLAQREITTPHAHSHAVKIMAGIEPLETVAAEVQREIVERREQCEELQVEIDTAQEEFDGLDVRPGEDDRLQSEERAWQERIGERAALREALGEGLATCAHNLQQARAMRAGQSTAAALRIVFLLLAAFLGAAWYLLAQHPQLEISTRLSDLLARYLPPWRSDFVPWLGYAAIGAVVIAAVFWMRARSRRGRAQEALRQVQVLGEPLRAVRELPEEPEVDADDDNYEYVEWSEATQSWQEVEFASDGAERPPSESNLRVQRALDRGTVNIAELQSVVDDEMAWLQGQIHRMSRYLALLQDDLEVVRDRVEQSRTLDSVLTGLKTQKHRADQDILVREHALELLAGAGRDLSARFSRDVRELVARILPVFTAGRYEHLNIDDELNVSVFSNDKRDFMTLDEMSSGTQRQIMLALRLALSQKLMNKLVRGVHFAFLDEPFAFFDQDRMLKAIEALNALRESVGQVWLVAQSYPSDAGLEFSLSLECEPGRDVLVHS